MGAKSNAGRVRVGVWGASGSGKSSYVKRQLAKRKRVVIFDPQGEYDATQAQVLVVRLLLEPEPDMGRVQDILMRGW